MRAQSSSFKVTAIDSADAGWGSGVLHKTRNLPPGLVPSLKRSRGKFFKQLAAETGDKSHRFMTGL